MEFFRWVLIFLGLALLAATYLLGRRKVDSGYRRSIADEAFDPSIEDLSVPISGRPSEAPPYDDRSIDDRGDVRDQSEESRQPQEDNYADDDADDDADDGEFLSDREIDTVISSKQNYGTEVALDISDEFDNEITSGENTRPAKRGGMHSVKSLANAVKQASQRNIGQSGSGVARTRVEDSFESSLADEFDTYGEFSDEEAEEKLVTISITAPRDHFFRGSDLKVAFDNHGYEFGRMSIYHCSHEKQKVFSIANMVKPGVFDDSDMDAFETSGITLFMRLPVALAPDVAFDFLIREATELAQELGGQLRDEDRSTLSKQTIQHMREDIQHYMFRQKRAASASLGV